MAEEENATVAAALAFILSTNALGGVDVPEEASAEGVPDRGFDGKDFGSFCKRVQAGRVTPTCVIDFAYEAKGILNLVGDDRQLERMYCFDDEHAKSRVVLHVHTPFRWGDRANKNPVARARFVTSANLRHAWKEGTEYSQEVEKFFLVPMAKVLQKGWHKLTVGETQWQWKVHGNMPAKEDASDWKTKARYNDVRKLIELGERLEPKHHVETVSIKDTEKAIRGGPGDGGEVEYEVVAVAASSTLTASAGWGGSGGAAAGVLATGSAPPPVTCPPEARGTAPNPAKKKPCILFVGINCKGMAELSVRRECETVREALMLGLGIDQWIDHVSIHDVNPSKGPTELADMVLKYNPDIVHIATHGVEEAMLLTCDEFVENWLIAM